MDDLLKFSLLRPPAATDHLTFLDVSASYATAPKNVRTLRSESAAFAESDAFVRDHRDLQHGATAHAVARHVDGGGDRRPASIRAVIAGIEAEPLASLVASPSFDADLQRLGDSVIACKVLSGKAPVDGAHLSSLLKAYAILGLCEASSSNEPLPLPRLRMAMPLPVAPAPREGRPPVVDEPTDDGEIARLRQASAVLAAMLRDPDAFEDPTGGVVIAAEDRADGVAGLVRESDQIPQRRTARSPWHASTAAIRSLPEDVRATLEDVDVDVRSMSLIEAITDLDAAIDARIAARLLI